MKHVWVIVQELPEKPFRLWKNRRTGCYSCFWNEIDPNNDEVK